MTPSITATPSFRTIALARSPYKEKFAIPRQPGLAKSVTTKIELQPPFDDPAALDGLEQVSHIWLIFFFHGVGSRDDALRVRPPRLGGNERIGVFATRSTHRPNGIGQSLVKIERIENGCIVVSGADLLDGTPIIDIKPYVPYADTPNDASNEIAPQAPSLLKVSWLPDVRTTALEIAAELNEDVVAVIKECLEQDPRPAYQKHDPEREYGVTLWHFNVRWRYPTDDTIEVIGID